MKFNTRQWLLTTTLVAGMGVSATSAFAQTAPTQPTTPTQNPTDTSGVNANPETTTPQGGETTLPSTNAQGARVESGQDVIVTGSRIPQPNLTAASPVTVVTAQEVKLQGTTRVEDLVNSLPQSFAAQGSNVSNGSTGTATVNLRGLGSSRTLVLVNGRRLMPGDPRSPVADINFIPSALIKRVDVLTGGASSVYGADAVAGVVNFIMDTTFTGIKVEGQVSTFNHQNRANSDITGALDARSFAYPKGMVTDGLAQDLSVAIGTGLNDNRGHVTAYATYRKQNAITQDRRDYSSCALSANTAAQVTSLNRLFSCGGSGTSANGTFQLFDPNFNAAGVFQVGPNAANGSGTFIPGSTAFNFAPYNYYQRPDERYTAGLFADYEVTPAVKPYLEAMFMDDRSVAQIAPSGDFGNTSFINCDNPLLSAQQLGIVCAPGLTYNNNGVTGSNLVVLRRNVEGGGRQDDLEHTAYRIVAGVRGDIATGLSYDASYQYGKVILAETYLNDFSVTRLTRALDVVANPAGGAPICRSVLNGTDPNCVPYNIFQIGGVTPAALNYLQTPGFQRGDTQEQVANINFTAELGKYGIQSPWSDRGLGLNFGAEYRKEALNLTTDTAFTTGDLAGQGGPTIGVNGQFKVRDFFVEAQAPIISEGFIYDLSLNGGYRNSRYYVAGNSFTTNTYKLEAQFAPVRDLRFRASYNRAVRAPNVVELFSAQSVGLAGTTDPCEGAAVNGLVNGFTAAQCARVGVSASQFGNVPVNPAAQYNGLGGGNPNLAPEKADSVTLGAIFQPRFIPGLALTVDAFDIKVKNLIGVIGVDTILNQCITTGDPFFCSRIQRDQFGSLYLSPNGFTRDTNTNVGGLKTRGLDVNGSYARRLGGLGNFNASFVGTYLKTLEVNPLADIRYNCAGFFGAQCGTPNPKWRHKFRLGLTLPNGLGISGQWRYFSRVRNDVLSSDTDLAGATPRPANAELKAQSYFDLALSARVGDHYNLRIGANNILDRQPPVGGSQVIGAPFGNGNTYPQVYDSLGRYLFAGVTIQF